jgi:hypothetical protein
LLMFPVSLIDSMLRFTNQNLTSTAPLF